ncbi:hypothetical protein HC028_04655 [Planosporangium flavigriseum]|uniref:Uncharacterized protein n=1 Tax=Planosporangium flavigriseum TaxID=373681 RepID=A0A8J3LI40_9ACTN|nr:hypothetical protein [Planosporangium flavigriseum]NJC63799.1 hypothetical protein [Planosporangium flavigriseum]GIG73703.1 hypothetical protein Pfl04_21070 [Planosporangium flavigriseum]
MSVVFDQSSPLVWLPITAFLIACAANGVAYLIGYAHGTKNSKIDAILNAQRAEREQFRGRRRRSRDNASSLTRHPVQNLRPVVNYANADTAVLERVPADADQLDLVRAGESSISEQRRGL